MTLAEPTHSTLNGAVAYAANLTAPATATITVDVQPPATEAPIFIVGSVHSGTTLLRKVLDRHPDIFSGRGESSFFHSFSLIQHKFPALTRLEERQRFVKYLVDIILTGYNKVNYSEESEGVEVAAKWELTAEQMTVVAACATDAQTHVAIFRHVYEALTALAGKSRWVEKTPGHLYYIDEILQKIPDARFIEIVRDPRDILSSKQARRKQEWLAQARSNKGAYADLQGGYDPLLDTLGWKSAVQAGMRAQQLHPDSVMRVRYEDFVCDPAGELARICNFLMLKAASTELEYMLDVGWSNTTTVNKNGVHGIGSESIGKWQRQLSPAAILLCQMIVRQEIQQLRYTVAKSNIKAYLALPLLLAQSGASLVDRLQRRWRLGGGNALRNQFGNYRSRLRSFFDDI